MVETFGQALRRLREAAGMSQPQLARRVPISQSSLSRYESDRQAADDAIAARLDDVLGAEGGLYAHRGPVDVTRHVWTPDDRSRVARAFVHPTRIDDGAVSALADVLAAQRRLDDVLGPEALIPPTMAQLSTVTDLVRQARGPQRDALGEVVAEYVQFAGWLHAEARRDQEAMRLLGEAEDAADEIGHGVLAAQAANFKGYLARQQDRPRGIVRWFLAEHHTPGAHSAQRVGAAAQAAQGYAELGDAASARRLLDTAGRLLDEAARHEPPRTAYWLTPTFHRLNIGLAHLSLAEHTLAAEHIRTGLDGLPEDQQHAEWTVEYRNALATAQQAG